MRADGGMAAITAAIERLSKCHPEHISQYGTGNEERLTGARVVGGVMGWVGAPRVSAVRRRDPLA